MTIGAEYTTVDQAREMGLSADEFDRICERLGRIPNLTELGIFSAMWSEHCSYKSSRRWLKTLPTSGEQVIHGPGENAGVVDIGDGMAAVFKIESHNHPSFIEPYQGAATGVGGILRDVFTMGARPVALLNALRFGAPDHALTRHLVSGVVSGIGGYGNCVGIPTIGGETHFDASYNQNILVNAMAVGLAKADRIFLSAASGVGNPVIYIGAKTGRDGIHGATMASAEFSEEDMSKRPTVQVGDPFAGKLLMEASLELMASDAVVSIQDMGAAGLTSSSVEMSSKGGLGMEINLDQVPVREKGMTPYEIMLSESQERMLVVLKPDATERAQAIFDKWDLDFAVIGKVTDTGYLVLTAQDVIVADLPLDPLVNDAPEYDRPHEATPTLSPIDNLSLVQDMPLSHALKAMLGSHFLASRRWVYEQYDRHVMADTVIESGGDAALVRVHGTNRGLAVTTDCTQRYVLADPYQGAMQAVAEAYRNITATGAKPLATTNNLNFGNPEKSAIMGQIVGSIKGMGAACSALNVPVVSGNVSLYNETDGQAIAPAPVIGMIGVIPNIKDAITIALKQAGETLYIIGQSQDAADGWLSNSVYAHVIAYNDTASAPPPVDLGSEQKHGEYIRHLITHHLVSAVHDIGDGGALSALVEMAMAGNIGVNLTLEADQMTHGWAFGEDQGRYLVASTDPTALEAAAARYDVNIQKIAMTSDDRQLKLGSNDIISIEELNSVYENWLPELMGSKDK
ncbi:MAG: phosphoribosylformylglycinamidine synthase subunit PurL [Alphaproteobacteria bacterium]|nr:phosphoribosylformylglycinamidine synthase subunit PurL [Alphaproteobacteria bacterium]